MNPEGSKQNDDIRMWGVADWSRAINAVDVDKKLEFYNDVISGRGEPSAELSKHLVLRGVSLGGKTCDVYHWDQDENGHKIENSSASRVYVHIKD